jgi:hypothetical protein
LVDSFGRTPERYPPLESVRTELLDVGEIAELVEDGEDWTLVLLTYVPEGIIVSGMFVKSAQSLPVQKRSRSNHAV